MRTRARLGWIVVLAVAAVLLGASPAAAHTGDDGGPTNYRTVIERVRPHPSGLSVRSVDLSSQVELRNRTGRTVVVLGYEDEPYLRIDGRGVFVNRRSPAAYLNTTRDGKTEVPAAADASARPRWERIGGGTTARWHDHRSHWMASDDPPAVRNDPGRSHVVLRDWEIPLRVGDRPVMVTGDLVWSPGPSLVPFGLAAGVLAAALVGAFLRFRRRQQVLLGIAAIVAVTASLAQALGFALAPDMTASPVIRFAGEGGFVLAIGWAGGVIAAWWLLVRGRADGTVVAGVAGLTIFLGAGLGEVSVLSKAHVGSAFGASVTRGLVVTSLGVGLGLALSAVMDARPRWLQRLVHS